MTVEGMLHSLARVDAQRELRRRDTELGRLVFELKAFQQGRLQLTYPDLLGHARWGSAARFFLEELYGPKDFSERDQGLARVVPTLVRLFPKDVLTTVERLLQLHAVSEELDTLMAMAARSAVVGQGLGQMADAPASFWDASRYGGAWRTVGRRLEREGQVRTVVDLGAQLDRLTRLPGLRQSLRFMRGPAQLSGLGPLQNFLERGFDAFKAMGGAGGFLATIDSREGVWLDFLFSGREATPEDPVWLGQFP